MKNKSAHHLWEAEKEDGKLRVKRTKDLDEDERMSEDKKARRLARRDKQNDAETHALACWGIWAASLVNDEILTRDIPRSIAARFNKVQPEDMPRVHSWDELSSALGDDKVSKVRKAIANGIKTRLISKNMNVPFLVAAEMIDTLDGLDINTVKEAVSAVKSGNKTASLKYGSLAREVKHAFNKFSGVKLAIDEKAKRYFEDYFGPYGLELVSDVQRRVRADLAYKWLKKNGIDDAAAEYWSNYFSEGGYGAELVSEVAKKLSPSNSSEEE